MNASDRPRPNPALDAARHHMLSSDLLDRGIDDPRVLEAMARVPRERFVLSDQFADAYADRALPIEYGQTISQPFIVGLMSQALALSGREHVLEVGTGSGYQAAVLAELAHDVVSIERHAPLSEQAAAVLGGLGYNNIQLVVGDGTQGWPPGAPYDRIIVAAATDRCPPALFEQLAEGGLLVIPLGSGEGQMLERIRKRQGRAEVQHLSACRFVPLVAAPGEP
ncbi:MAG: protein-L-isoaspartate(D-aspartate) O-methyltransferase [Pirellulales bacterium]